MVRHRIAAIACVAGLAGSCLAQGLVNGSFEDVDAKGDPAGWGRYGKDNARVLGVVEVGATDGRRCVEILPIVATSVEAPCFTQTIPVTAGQVYRVTARVRGENVLNPSAGTRLFWHDAKGEWIWNEAKSGYAGTGSFGWRYVECDGAAPEGATAAVIELFGDVGDKTATGTVWIDDVRFEQREVASDWADFKVRQDLVQPLSDLAFEYDRAVVLAAWVQDAMRGAKRLASYRRENAPKLDEPGWDEIGALRERYRAIYPLVTGKPVNGWPHSHQYFVENYQGKADLGDEIADMTDAAKALQVRQKAALAAWQAWIAPRGSGRKCAWAEPDLSGEKSSTMKRHFRPDGSVDQIVFGGSTFIPDINTHFRHARLMQYDYEMQIYEDMAWADRAKPDFRDEQVLGRFASRSLGVDMILSYANHGFMYVPEWLWPQVKDDPTAYVSEKAVPKAGAEWSRFADLNCDNPKVHEAIEEYLRLIGEHYRGDARVQYYRGPWEAFDSSHGQESGHDAASVKVFRAWLKAKFGAIERLNAAWGSEYASFDDVAPPDEKGTVEAERPTPLMHEFELWRKDRCMGWWTDCYKLLKRADSTHPVGTDPCALVFDVDTLSAVDYERLAETGDIVSIHDGRAGPECDRYLYSIWRYARGKTLGSLEYVWNGPECWNNPQEPVVFAAGERNLWRGAGLGLRVWQFYGQNDTYVGWPSETQSAYNNLADFETNYSLLRPCAGVVPLMHAKMNAMKEAWFAAKPVEPRIGILEPTTTANSYKPAEKVRVAAFAMTKVLEDGDYHHAVVFERELAAGRDRLANYKVLLLPYAVALPEWLGPKLVAWVKGGGVLIAAGPFAQYTAYGKDDGAAWRGILGEARIADGTAVQDVSFGRGRAMVIADFSAVDVADNERAIWAMIDKVAPREAWCEDAKMGLIVREGKGGVRYVVAFNRSVDEAVESEVRLAWPVRKATDLGVRTGAAVPLRKQGAGVSFRLRLEPGEGTVVKTER